MIVIVTFLVTSNKALAQSCIDSFKDKKNITISLANINFETPHTEILQISKLYPKQLNRAILKGQISVFDLMKKNSIKYQKGIGLRNGGVYDILFINNDKVHLFYTNRFGIKRYKSFQYFQSYFPNGNFMLQTKFTTLIKLEDGSTLVNNNFMRPDPFMRLKVNSLLLFPKTESFNIN